MFTTIYWIHLSRLRSTTASPWILCTILDGKTSLARNDFRQFFNSFDILTTSNGAHLRSGNLRGRPLVHKLRDLLETRRRTVDEITIRVEIIALVHHELRNIYDL